MDIWFNSNSLAKRCNKAAKCRQKYGAQLAKKIQLVLDDLRDMESLAEVALFPQYKTKYRFHKLSGEREGQYAIDLDKQNRITFVPDEDPPPVKEDGSLDLEAVTAICITFVGDYHD